tara:strand:- start:6290 stop:6433 length:144 start_codon:yes stop_codon:yes gene_type:complete
MIRSSIGNEGIRYSIGNRGIRIKDKNIDLLDLGYNESIWDFIEIEEE